MFLLIKTKFENHCFSSVSVSFNSMNIIEVFIQLLAEHTEFVGYKSKRELHSDCLQAKNGFHILNGWGKVKIRIIFHDT